ncbi:helix-turn-helix domain-containing protein [Prevotella jejuni]
MVVSLLNLKCKVLCRLLSRPAISNYLRTTDMSVKEISNLLGFPNTSFFGKYVHDRLGCSPFEYRRQQKER